MQKKIALFSLLTLMLATTGFGCRGLSKTEAAAVLDACAGEVTDDNTRARVSRLRAELADAFTRPPADPAPAANP